MTRRTLRAPRAARRTIIAAAAAAALALTGCAADGGDDAASGTEFTFLSYLPLESLSMAPDMVALSGGYFEDHGLDVTLQPVKGAPVALQSVLGGVGPLTRVGGIDLMTAAADGQELTNVGTIVSGPSLRIISAEGKPLEKPEDFVGATIGIPSEGGTSDKSLTLMLEKAGVDPDSVKRQVVGLTPGTFALVQKGQIDAYMVSIDTAMIVQAQNDDAVIMTPDSGSGADTQVYTTTPGEIEAHGDEIEDYLAAVQEAVQFMLDDEDNSETLKLLRDNYDFATLNDDAVANAALDEAKKLWANGGDDLLHTDPDAWAQGYDDLTASDLAPAGGDAAAWVSNDLIK